MSVDLIELARANDIHLLVLPAHTTHILCPLDVGVLKSFKAHFSKASSVYLSKNKGSVITNDQLASLVATAWPNSFTPNNIKGGFRKTGIFPLNSGAIDDRDLAPSKAVQYKSMVNEGASDKQSEEAATAVQYKPMVNEGASDKQSEEAATADSVLFTPEQEKLFEQRFQEGYDLKDPEYEAWLRITHPIDARSEPRSGVSESDVGSVRACSSSASEQGSKSSSSSSAILREVLILPQPKQATGKRKKAINNKAICITDLDVLEELKVKEAEKLEVEELRKQKQAERAKKRLEREERKKEKQLEKETKRLEREEKWKIQEYERRRKKGERELHKAKERQVLKRQLRRRDEIESDNNSSDEAVCPKCGLIYPDDGGCDGCNQWFNMKCTTIKSKKHVPDVYYCEKCDM